MRSRNLFLLLYLLGSFFGVSNAQRNATCTSNENCNQVPDSTSHFLQCVGLPSTDKGRDHMQRLKGMLEATMDVYTFMRSSMTGVPILSLQGKLALSPKADPLQNEALVQMWLEAKMKPLLKSVTKHFLSCLSTMNFSCCTYQTVVREISHHFSEMDPVRQKWIYTFFMYPFLSGDRVAGCVSRGESSEDWLTKNFGAFRAMARMKDFSALNMVFSGLEVLHLLTPAQKAELLLRPEVASIDNGTLSLVFHSLLTGGSQPPTTLPPTSPGSSHNWMTTGYPPSYSPKLTYIPPPPQNSLQEVAKGFSMVFRPVGSFVHNFVAFTHGRNLSELRSTTLTQFLLNWTLSEVADLYRPHNASVAPEAPKFDVTNVEDWYEQVVMPLLRRFLPNDAALMHQNLTLAFHQVYYLDHGKDTNETSETVDVCSISLDKKPCGLTDAVENAAKVLHCAARTNLTMSEATIMRLITELTGRLNLLIQELSRANFSELASDFQQIFGEAESPSMTQEHLNDPNFIKLWFQIKLMPLLPAVPTGLLSCLSTKNFSCPVYQTIVAALSKHMSFMEADSMHSHNIYQHFIYSFLLHHNTSDAKCMSNHSAEWMEKNVGFFSRFAPITDFYRLYPNFSGLEVLHLLTPKQTAELLVLPLPTPPEKDVVVNRVFDFLLASPKDRKFKEVLHYLVPLAKEVNPPCAVYKHTFERLYGAIKSLPPDLEPVAWAGIDDLITIAPDECVPNNVTCQVTQYNDTNVCRGRNSSDYYIHMNTSMEVSCNLTLETYACAQLENFTANQLASLLRCNLPGKSDSKVLWKILLTKLSSVLDPALDILANMSMVGPSATEILDVIGEMRVFMLTDEQLMNSSVIRKWFSSRLRRFLPSASGRFLHCLSSRNLSCHSYQQIVQIFIHHFDNMTLTQQHVVFNDFVLRFLSGSGQGCVSNNSAEWLMKNLGPFSGMLSLRELLDLNPHFKPLEVLQLLTPKQTAELLVLIHPTLPDKDALINMIFDHFNQSSDKKKFTDFLSDLVMVLQKANLSCSSYKTLFKRLDMAMAGVYYDAASSIIYTKMVLSKHLPPGCNIYSGKCTVTMTNETDICAGVNSTKLQHRLDSAQIDGRHCYHSVEEFACASLSALKAEDLAATLACNRSYNSTSSRPVWKLFLSKASHVLDEALDLLANKTLDPRSPAVTAILDSIREIRLDAFSPASFNNPAVIQLWFSRLRPFLPAVSPDFLSCLITKDLNCSTYQHIIQILSHLQPHMTHPTQMSVYTQFIKVYLTMNSTGQGCVSNNSAEWLMKNLGRFSGMLSLRELLDLNPHFKPLEVLQLLTPKQTAELLVLIHPTLPDKDALINMIFDHFNQSSDKKKFTDFLSDLVMVLQKANLSCSSYKTLSKRLDMAMAGVYYDAASSIIYTKMVLSKHLPLVHCNHDKCTKLQHRLDSAQIDGHHCYHSVEEFTCASLSALKAEDLAATLACNRSYNSTSSRPVWKLFLSKASHVLDEALDLLANKTLDPRSPAVTAILDSIREIRLDAFSPASFNNPAVIQLWFSRLRPFLPAVSHDFLSCLITKDLNCSTYQHIVQILSHLQPHMTHPTQMSVYTQFIKVYLTMNTTGQGCVSNNSAEWLMKNLGPFSGMLSLRELLDLNPHFKPLEVLQLLTPKQTAELLVLIHPTLPDKDALINMIFDHFNQSSDKKKFTDFLSDLVMVLQKANLSCSSYKTLSKRLDMAMAGVYYDAASSIIYTKMVLSKHLPLGCNIYSGKCTVTMTNETDICAGVNSTKLQHRLDSAQIDGHHCYHSVEEFACASLSALKAEDLAATLACNRSYNSTSSRPVWKLFLSKASHVLDEALDLLANKTLDPRSPAVTAILDSIREIRLDAFSPASFNNPAVIQLWFSRLRPFLPAVSHDFLSCLITKDLNCSTYQHIVQILSHLQPHMTYPTQMSVYTHFIKVYLTMNTTGQGCVSNNSAEWLMKNLGRFSGMLSLRELLDLNPHFKPLEVLQLLTPKQTAELLVLIHPTLPDKDTLINMIFDHFNQSPDKKKFTDFLSDLVMVLQKANLSCSSYKTLFNRLDMAMTRVSLNVASSIIYTKMALSKHLPPETDICIGVNSTKLQHRLDSAQIDGHHCYHSVEEFACASLSALKAEDLAATLACNRSYNSTSSRPVWKLFLSKASHVLDEALDLLANKTLDPRSPVVATILDSIREIRLDAFGPASFNNPAFIQLWFNHRLRPFLPAVSPDFLSCLTTKGLNCSTYQHIVQILSHLQPHMTLRMQMSIYTHFIKVYLTMKNATDPGCSLHTNNSGEWLQKNLGGFSALVSFYDLRMLYSNFSAMEALPYLTVRQIADVSATPGQLTSPKHVTMVMNHVPNQHLAAFFDDFSPAIMGQENKFPPLVRSAFLQVVFDRANLSDHSVDDSDVSLWLRTRLRPLLVNLSPLHVAPFFAILAGRNCSIGQQGVQDLNSTIFSLSEVTQNEIHNHIIQSLRGPVPLRCYGDNYNHSFYSFLESSFLDFQFPNLTTFLSLMPHNKMHQLVNSMPPSHLGDFLRRPDVVNNDAELCVLYNNYMQIPVFLETESLPAKVRRSTLPCVWPRALSSSERSEVNAWFDQRLQNYLVFLTKSLISPDSTYNASCLAFQKLVSVLGEHNYTAADFMRQDVFSTIRTYLTSATVPRCYNASDPELNSTAWFAEYIGPFMPFLILEDLQAFGSAEVLKVFTVNPLNIALLNHSALPLNLTNYYTELVYQQDSNFNPLLLPLLCRCVAPGLAFSQLDANESMIVLHNLTTLCTDLDPQISAALAANFGDQIDATTITSLGNESTGLSTGQIKSIKPQDLLAALGTLSSVTGWNGGQAKAIILSLISSGMMQISSASSLFQLGSLIVGIPTSTFSNVNGSQLLTASKNPSFLQHLMSAPQIIQQTFVTQIISVNSNSETIIKNIPDDLATEIPRVLLLGFSNDTTVITTLNKKKWKKQQAELFFDVVAVESATTTLGSANNLSSSVLQGFTCTGVRTIKKVQIKKLIKACRRKGKKKVKLVETQLTCMYNYIRIESDATSFDLYPPDMLLYYDYSLVPQASCKSYFEQIGDADFSIFSSTLNYKLNNLFANARSCLGITNTSLTEDNISVLGNMCCILGGFYIENSDPSILETLKTCPDLTNTQVAAVEARLQSGKTQYGAPSTWNLQTLKDLDMLPLYLTSSFYDNFDKKTKREFLKYFLKVLRRNGVGKKKKRSLKKEIRKSIRKRSTRSIENECTVGKITQVIISDEVFPFDYDDINQFNCCLSATIVKNNLASITDKVDQEEYLTIVLSKLREAYGANSTIPESQVQLLGPASRVATTDDINLWTITQIDTLSALMDSSNGQWDPSLAKAIVTKYLSQEGNKLGSAELNAIGGTNLCSLDVDVLRSISQQSLKDAEALTLSNCTTEKHKALFTIARQAFGTDTRATTISTKSYQLTSSYLPGATLDYVRSLSASDVNMDMATFTSLDENVVLDLTVNEVKNLLGTNLPDLKSYEEQTLVQKWIRSQYQSELNTLGIGLQGGRADPATTTTAPTVATVAPVTTSLTTAGSGTGTTATTGNGSRLRADHGFSVLVLLSLLIASLHFLV
ncbi:Mesothelin Pre-pro-megakaryocyte-potentiating factor [Larimichthys crocea]|uniref:Mesothelin Pre-pro-megakaryocyte-potentiating factor n=1 Tax=Larimichthys crocea TaxID=215358 RepID=A0A6G0JA18_LARCR|nr:Mesothelin Pre-pro-megakaryocyte-potentiating factor [Larimichthys crocea]